MSIGEEIRASAGAHRDLGPGYDTAIAEGLVERIGEEIDRRVDARLYRHAGPPPGPVAPATGKQVKSGPGFFTAVMVLGSMAMGIGASAVVLAPDAHVTGSGALVLLIWVAIGAINYFWSRRRLPGHDGAEDALAAVLPEGADPFLSDPRRSVWDMMNPPRRRRASLQGTFGKRCRCAECEAITAGADSASMRAVAGEISAVGWSVRTAPGDELTPPWAYTVGLWQTRQGPELVMAGLPPEHMTIILNVIADRIADGIPIDVADEITGICPCSLTIRPVHPSWRETSMLAISDRYYGYVRPRYLQVVWPDRRGRYPGDRGFQTRYEGRQPMLWLPVEDHPPCTWTRLDVAC